MVTHDDVSGLSAIRIRLERRRRALLERYLSERDGAPELLEARHPEVVERGTDDWYVQVLDRMSEHDRRQLELIDAARARLDENRYGFCLVCGRPVEPERLAALPETPLCMADARAGDGRPPLEPIGEPW
jgi:DnaK suppressor protein